MKMNKFLGKIVMLSILATPFLMGCDSFDRTDVTKEIYVDHSSLTLFVGDAYQLKASPEGGTFEWSTSDDGVATVSNGLVTAVNTGTARIVAKQGDATFTVAVTVQNKVALEDIKLSSENVEINPNASVTIVTSTVPTDANDVPLTDFAWWSDNEDVARVTSAGNITGISEGEATIYYRRGKIVKKVHVAVAYTFPFNGPHILTSSDALELLFRDFDKGGEGYGYHDSNTSNQGGSSYRSDNGDTNSPGVDIEGSGNIGYTSSGEWLLYTLSVQDAGTYDVYFTASGNGGTAHFELDGKDVTGLITVASTGGWGTYKWVGPVNITFTKGTHHLKFYMDKAAYNIYEMYFEMSE
jgi:hypothetical protein